MQDCVICTLGCNGYYENLSSRHHVVSNYTPLSLFNS